ncbi:MAG TPA: glycosyltransferase family 4 protein [Candidatus Dormibacteraeota bacterium]|nr:glycosyltransferase family 4 protein [Candidatus Dormibacteraeota bacterium]
MKILFITRKYPPSTGGMQLFAYDLSRALAAKVNVRLVKWGGSNRALPIVLPYLFLSAAWQLLKGGIEVIHVQDGLLAPMAYLLSRLSSKPYAVVLHGLDVTYGNRLYRASVLPAIRRADTVFCISQAAASEATRRGVQESKVNVIPLAVQDRPAEAGNKASLELPANGPALITVGRLVKRKGVAWFIGNALPDLIKKYPSLIYMVVGEGGERSAIETAVAKTGLDQNVRLLGRVDDELLESAYARADIFVMPNITVPGDMEGFGLVLLEASARGLPVVASDMEGIKDAVSDGKNGVLVPSGDTAAFKREIRRFLDDPGVAKKFGAQSRSFTLATYRWDKLADRYIEQYKRLIDR